MSNFLLNFVKTLGEGKINAISETLHVCKRTVGETLSKEEGIASLLQSMIIKQNEPLPCFYIKRANESWDRTVKNSESLVPYGSICLYPFTITDTIKEYRYCFNTENRYMYSESLENYFLKGIVNEDEFNKKCSVVNFTSINTTASILKINTIDEYLFVRAIFGEYKCASCGFEDSSVSSINYENLSQLFNGVCFSQSLVDSLNKADMSVEYALHSFKHETIIMFDGSVSTPVPFKEEYKDGFYSYLEVMKDYTTAVKSKLESVYSRFINLNDLELIEENGTCALILRKAISERKFLAVSENEYYRSVAEKTIVPVFYKKIGLGFERKEKECLAVPGLIKLSYTDDETDSEDERSNIFHIGPSIKNSSKYQLILEHGFYDEYTGEHFYISMKSSSDDRTRKCLCSPKQAHELIYELTYGVQEFKSSSSFVVATAFARASLKFSTSKEITNFHPSVKVLRDPSVEVQVNATVPVGLDEENGKVYLFDNINKPAIEENVTKTTKIKPTDGGILISVEACIVCNAVLGKISKKERDFFLSHFVSMEHLRQQIEKASGLADLNLIAPSRINEYQKHFYEFISEIKSIKRIPRTLRKMITILSKCSSGLQIRYCGLKGLAVMYDFKYHRPELSNYDVIAGNGACKFNYDKYSSCSFGVCSSSKISSEEVKLNYQFVQSLDISSEDLVGLAKRALDKVTTSIFQDPAAALKFAGQIHSTPSCEEEEIGSEVILENSSKIVKILSANPDFIKDSYVQDKLKGLVGQYIYEIGFGRIPVEGSYNFLFTDPKFLLFEGNIPSSILNKENFFMEKGENYLNGDIGKVAFMRSPNLYKSEIQNLSLSANSLKDNWYIKDIIIFNAEDPTLLAAQGADIDGDKGAIIKNSLVIKAVSSIKDILMNFDAKGIKKEAGVENKIAFDEYLSKSLRVSNIGRLSYNAAILRDFQQCLEFDLIEEVNEAVKLKKNETISELDKKIKLSALATGWEIDSSKTGLQIVYPKKDFYEKFKPNWLLANREYKNDTVAYVENKGCIAKAKIAEGFKNRTCYYSHSPMGMLFKYVDGYALNFFSKDSLETINFSQQLTSALFSQGKLLKVHSCITVMQELELNYRKDMQRLLNEYAALDQNDEKVKESMTVEVKELQSLYRDSAYSINQDPVVLGACAYLVSYEPSRSTASKSFAWSVLFEEVICSMSALGNSTKLVSLPSFVKTPYVKVNNLGALFSDSQFVRMTSLPSGEYKVCFLNEKPYIFVRRKSSIVSKEQLDSRNTGNKVYHLLLGGHNDINLNSLALAERLQNGNFYIQKTGKEYAVLESETHSVLSYIKNPSITFIDSFIENELSYVSHTSPVNVKTNTVTKNLKVVITPLDTKKPEPSSLVQNIVEVESFDSIDVNADFNSFITNSSPVSEEVQIPSSFNDNDLNFIDNLSLESDVYMGEIEETNMIDSLFSNSYSSEATPMSKALIAFPNIFSNVLEEDLVLPSFLTKVDFSEINLLPVDLNVSFGQDNIFEIGNINLILQGGQSLSGKFVLVNTLNGVLFDFVLPVDIDDLEIKTSLIRYFLFYFVIPSMPM